MAKDRRNKVRPTMDLDDNATPNNAQARRPRPSADSMSARRTRERNAQDEQAPKKRKKRHYKKKKLSRAALIIRCVLAVLIIFMLIFFACLGMLVYKALIVDTNKVNDPIDPTPHEMTPTDKAADVSYYLLGLLGEETTDEMTMLSLACHDKKAGTISVLQIPASTYIDSAYVNAAGETVEMWDVDTAGKIFGNPKDFLWCENNNAETCRRAVYEPEIIVNDEGVMVHNVQGENGENLCGTPVTKKRGSSTQSLLYFVNEQLGLPVDDYFIMYPDTLEKLVGYVGGINVDFSDGEGTDVRLVNGEEAVSFVNETNRAARQRQVFAALLKRIFDMGDNMNYETVEEEVIGPVMSSDAPIRTKMEEEEITALLQEVHKIGLDKVTVYLMPSETTYTADGASVYSAHREELLTLINDAFRPHMDKLTLADVTIPELVNTGDADEKKGTLGEVCAEQSGMILEDTAQADVGE